MITSSETNWIIESLSVTGEIFPPGGLVSGPTLAITELTRKKKTNEDTKMDITIHNNN